MNDNYEDQLDQIRISIYEHTKNMNSKERADYFNNKGRILVKQYGFKVAEEPELSLQQQEVMA